MRARNIILLMILAGALGGCTWLKQRWPWRKAEVPVTSPKEQVRGAPREGIAPPAASEAATRPAAPVESPAHSPRLVEPIPQTRRASDTPSGRKDDAKRPPPKPDRPPPGPKDDQPRGKTVVVAAPGLLINDRFITIEEILRSVADLLAAIPEGRGEDEFRREAAETIQREIRRQIFEGMVLPEAERRLTDMQKRFVQKEMADRLRDMIAEFGGSRKKLEDYYARRGTTLDKIMKLERDSFVVRIHLQAKFAPAISVNRRMLLQYYRKHKKSKYTLARKVQMQIISTPFKAFIRAARPSKAQLAAARADARKQIEKARKELAAGADFADVAARLSKGPMASKGGTWPAMEAGSFRQTKVEDAAFAIKEGKVSDVIETETGFFVVKAAKVYPGKVIGFEEAQDHIERILRDEQLTKLQAEYFDRLLARATITSSGQLVQLGTDQAVRRYWRKKE